MFGKKRARRNGLVLDPAPDSAPPVESRSAAQELAQVSAERAEDSFADFQRAVLQDNISLCDIKAGVLLAFSGALVVFCLDASFGGEKPAGIAFDLPTALMLASAAGFFLSCHLALLCVAPRVHVRGRDHLYWGSPVFRTSGDKFVAAMRKMKPMAEHEEKLRHVHGLASICRRKFRYLDLAIRAGLLGFLLLMASELTRAIAPHA